jgi:hypothetical protein
MAENPNKRLAKSGKHSGVIVQGPDGSLHGNGSVIAAADAYTVRPQDCAPRMRQIIFGDRA